ncbi:MAG: thioredoxin domain-containing protein [Thermoleophilia bacterium]
MKISCYLSPGCGSEEELRANIDLALRAESISAEVSLERIDDREAAVRGLSGSPSVLIDGKELRPAPGSGFS